MELTLGRHIGTMVGSVLGLWLLTALVLGAAGVFRSMPAPAVMGINATLTLLGLADPSAMAPMTYLPMSLLPTFVVPLILVTHVILFIRLAKERPA